MRDLLSELRTDSIDFPAAALANANTPEEWSKLRPRSK
jgi:hypothetical protein